VKDNEAATSERGYDDRDSTSRISRSEGKLSLTFNNIHNTASSRPACRGGHSASVSRITYFDVLASDAIDGRRA
jgi:hypothetical protein